MKKLLSLFTVLFALCSIALAQTTTDKAAPEDAKVAPAAAKGKVVFATTTHNFGEIAEGTQAKFTFKFVNEGDAPVVLSNVRASCGCTTPKWNREPVAVGANGEVTAVYNSSGRPGTFNKTVTVTTNAGTFYLKIRGTVKPKQVPAKTPVIIE